MNTSTYNSSLSVCGNVRSTIIETGNGHYTDICIVIVDKRAGLITLVMNHECGTASSFSLAFQPEHAELALRNVIVRSGFRLHDEHQLMRLVRASLGR